MSDPVESVARAVCDAAPARLECEFLPIDPPILAQAAIAAHLAWLEANGFAVVPPDVLQFLMGADPLEGVWFGEPHPTRKGKFWWRTVIRERAMIAAAKGGHPQ